MERVALPDILDTKVVSKQEKHNGAPLVALQARSGGSLVVSVLLETLLKEGLKKGSQLW